MKEIQWVKLLNNQVHLKFINIFKYIFEKFYKPLNFKPWIPPDLQRQSIKNK